MANARELYADYINNKWFCVSDYDPMIDAFGNVLFMVEDHDYQGDTRVLYEKDGKIGHLIFGWGSCCCCDALQACNNIDDVQELCDQLENSIRWFDTPEEALNWFKTHDWEGDWCWGFNETKTYVEIAIKTLTLMCGKE